MRQSQAANYLAKCLVLHEVPSQLDESVGKLQPQAILPGESSTDFGTQYPVKRGRFVVGLAEVIDLGFKDSVPPARQKADPTADFSRSEHFQYSGQAPPPYANRCAIQWAMPVPRPISTPSPIDPRIAAMKMPSVSPNLF